ncbi:EH domain-binding protein 1 [Labeo rohita]|uniref:EH domain-binding protein 1 n=1 Tax=Labeo rohita TaxID=84645 RepID=A0ABQ8LWH5_LABRO|nr:EH domain-binding protein 1 [Labeo rohita]
MFIFRQPDKLVVVWTRRSRRKSSKSHSWQPGIKNPYRGVVVWPVPENIEITVTLFKDPHAEEFEDKEWTFVIENVSAFITLLWFCLVLLRMCSLTPSAQIDATGYLEDSADRKYGSVWRLVG